MSAGVVDGVEVAPTTGQVSPTADDQAAKARALRVWTADRARFLLEHPLVATLALHLKIVPVVDARLPTAATDGRSLFVNPYFLSTLTPDERVFLLAHEVWHEALLHGRRRALRDPRLWNLAADHEVNHLLREDGLKMPADGILYAEHAGASAEHVYAVLEAGTAFPQRRGQQRRPGSDIHLGSPDGADPFEGTGRGLGNGDGEGDDDSGDDSGDSQDGDGAEGQAADETFARFGPIAGKVDPDFRTAPDPTAADDWASRVVALSGQLAGRLPAGLTRAIDQVLRPKVPWPVLLRDFVSRSAGGRLSWLPPSRRHVHRGLYLPSRRNDTLRIAVAIDTSGSTTMEMPRFVAELGAILRAFGRYEVRLVQCDADIGFDERFDDSRPLSLSSLRMVGGGGTDFRPVFRRLAGDPPQALVFLTDGYGPAPAEPPAYPVLWLLTSDGTNPAPWGRVVKME